MRHLVAEKINTLSAGSTYFMNHEHDGDFEMT